MWHSLQAGEADKLFNKRPVLARGLTMMWQQDCSITEGICRLEWCEDESDALHPFEPTELCTEGENDSIFTPVKCCFLSHRGHIGVKPAFTRATEALVDICAQQAEFFCLILLLRETSPDNCFLYHSTFLLSCYASYIPPLSLLCLHHLVFHLYFLSPATCLCWCPHALPLSSITPSRLLSAIFTTICCPDSTHCLLMFKASSVKLFFFFSLWPPVHDEGSLFKPPS